MSAYRSYPSKGLCWVSATFLHLLTAPQQRAGARLSQTLRPTYNSLDFQKYTCIFLMISKPFVHSRFMVWGFILRPLKSLSNSGCWEFRNNVEYDTRDRATIFGNTATTSMALCWFTLVYSSSLWFLLATKAFSAMRWTLLLSSCKSESMKGDWRPVCMTGSLLQREMCN